MDNNLCTELDQSLYTFFSENPQSFHPFLWHEREALLSDSTSPYDLENNTFALFAEILSPRLGFDRSDIPQKRYYDYICEQIYRFFTRRGYEGEHLTADALREMLITTTAVTIARQTGWDAALVTAAVTLVVSTTLKIGIRAWCPDIAAQIEAAKSRMRVFGIVDTLEYLHKGGRMSTSVAVVGSLLRVKPIITLKDGVLGLVGKGVGTKGSLAGMLKQVGDDIHPDPRLPIYYGYSGDDTLCRQFVPLMEEKFGPHGQEIRSIGCVIGTHLGPNAAVVAYLEQDK